MIRTRSLAALLALISAGAATVPLAGEVTSIAGFTEVMLTEFIGGQPGDTVTVTDEFPETDTELPLQVLAQLLPPPDSEELSAAIAAAQFADPRIVTTPNPEEFAINIALDSVSEVISYDAFAISQEARGVLFSPGEISSRLGAGASADLIGTFFVDGVLAFIATDPNTDLTGMRIEVTLKVDQINANEETISRLNATLLMEGGVNGDVNITLSGGFPSRTLILTDLTNVVEDQGLFRVLVIPQTAIDYTYDAIVGQPFTLRSSAQVTARNIPGENAIAAVLGTPVDAINQGLSLVQGTDFANQVTQLIARERENPTGEPAFQPTPGPALGLCAPLGFSSVFGLAALSVISARGSRRRRSR